jgi:hypothetical protein
MRLVSSLPKINSIRRKDASNESAEPPGKLKHIKCAPPLVIAHYFITSSDAELGPSETSAVPSGQLVRDEGRESGSVKLSVYIEYARYIGVAISLVLGAAMIGGQGAYLASDLWLAFWSRSSPSSQGDDRSEVLGP